MSWGSGRTISPPDILHSQRHSHKLLYIEKLVPGGDGLGRLNGKAVLIPMVIPGEKVKVKIVKEYRGYDKAALLDILEPSPNRISPKCPYFGICGGCNWQHIDYKAQRDFKKAVFKDAMTRIGKLTVSNLALEYGKPWRYRNRARFRTDSGGNIGFLRKGSNTLIDLRDCPVLHQGLAGLLKNRDQSLTDFLQKTYKAAKPGAKLEINAFAAEYWQAHPANPDPLKNGGRLCVRILERPIYFSLNCFFQSNLEMLPSAINHLITNEQGELAVDLYCGVGLYSAFLSDRFQQVSAIERDPISIGFVGENVTIPNARIINKPVELVQTAGFAGQVDMVIANPPRAGLSSNARDFLTRVSPKKLAYVSCNPVTLARDLGSLVNRGPFTIQDIKLFDYYPQTDCVESITRLFRAKN